MHFEKPLLKQLANESDVEQKFIHPLLVADVPTGFGIRSSYIVTKANIRRFLIDKGSSHQKLYYPDYVIVIGGLPVAVIEGKGRDVNLVEAFREARLYAHEINAMFEASANPVSVVCATNANELWIGSPNQAQPSVIVPYDDIGPYSESMAEAHELLGFEALRRKVSDLSALLKERRYFKPRRMIGGLSVQQEELGKNSFGANLAAELAHIFNPVSKEDRIRIATEGYVSSPRRDQYVKPIDKVIRAAVPHWQSSSTLIENTAAPKEFVGAFGNLKELEHGLLLLIGERGSGKTTFLYHLQAVALPSDLREKTVWIHLDVNAAPVTSAEIYKWVREGIIAGLRESFPENDYDDLDTLQRIYSVEFNQFKRGAGRLLREGSDEYNHGLYRLLLKVQDDLDQTALCYTRYFGSERGALIVIVFDNADKGPRSEQLLMFEVAQWLQKRFRVLVILPLREETYDNYRDQPPLDTALKDLVFRIEPPVFQQALIKRVQIALDELALHVNQDRTYELANGFRIKYAETERSYFLTSIAASIFNYDSYSRRLVMGLAGNNLRRVFEIFVEFCTSGHIDDGEILRMRQSKGDYVLPLQKVMTVLLRANRRYYDGDSSVIKNIVDLEEKDERPTHFSRLLILMYLRSRFTEIGPNGLKGFASLFEIHQALTIYGLRFSMVQREVSYLARANCVVAESQNEKIFEENELFKIGPVGFVHLELLGVAEYWSAIAEDTNYDNRDIARRIADRIAIRDTHYSGGVGLQNARAAFDYVQSRRQSTLRESSTVVSNSRFLDYVDLSSGDEALLDTSKTIVGGLWYAASERLLPGVEVDGTIVNIVDDLGLFVEVEPGMTGLLHKSRMLGGVIDKAAHAVGAVLKVKVVSFEPARRRMSLSLTSRGRGG